MYFIIIELKAGRFSLHSAQKTATNQSDSIAEKKVPAVIEHRAVIISVLLPLHYLITSLGSLSTNYIASNAVEIGGQNLAVPFDRDVST